MGGDGRQPQREFRARSDTSGRRASLWQCAEAASAEIEWPADNGSAYIVPKQTNSAFIGTDLEARLRAGGHDALVVAGVITNNSVEATVRMAGNLGFRTWLVADGCFTFARPDWNGTPRSADDVHAMSLANLHSEYCAVVSADALLGTSSQAE
ncbi:isochorismatase family protein [Burkholderia ubonensis]|uniref:isochorismatase family protein n=1 Tax=Burkholderia ubonensis TaxID=101571 RepID=UPI000B2B64FD